MSQTTITAIFDSYRQAQDARDRLVSLGLAEGDVRVVSQGASDGTTTTDHPDGHKGIWESIKDFFIADEDRETYTEGLRRGAFLLTARVDDRNLNEARSSLESSGAIDLDQRVEEWRSSGWQANTGSRMGSDVSAGSSARAASNSDALADTLAASEPVTMGAPIPEPATASTRTTASSDSGIGEAGERISASASRGATQSSNMSSNVRSARSDASSEESLPVIEERLRVGKRDVTRGSVRVRAYVVEEPVHEDVTLREERVEVERRPVAGRSSAAGSDGSLLQERTIEMTEHGEEAVVQKDAVVTEEVVVRKFTGERTEGIDETVRHTEVDVDEDRGEVPTSGRQPSRSTTQDQTTRH
jgi:uncharacterized protein (TIGR02271 family)